MSPAHSRPENPLAERMLFAGLVALVLWLPLPWGSHTPGATAAFGAATAALTAAWLLLFALGRLPPVRLSAFACVALAVWLAWIGWIALQILPLPPERLALLSPQAIEAHRALESVGAPALNTISIAPGRTREELILTLNYLSLYGLTLVLASSAARQRTLLYAIVVSGLFQALYGAIMTLSGLEYGFFEPKAHYRRFATGTFVNRNHLAAYLELSLAAGTALVLTQMTRWGWGSAKALARDLVALLFSPKIQVRVFLAIQVIALVMTRSRMGNTAFFAGLLLSGGLYLLIRHRRWLGRGLVFFLSLVLIDVLILSRWYGLEKVVERIERTELPAEQRYSVFEQVQPAVRDYLLTGSGLGSFADVHARYRSAATAFFDHAHNEYLELLIEAGAIGLGLLVLLAALHFTHSLLVIQRRRNRDRSATAFAALMALACTAVHATTEFHLHIPAIAATLTVMLAMVAACPLQSRSRRRPSSTVGAAAPSDEAAAT